MSVKIPARVIGKPLYDWEIVLKDTFNLELLYKYLHETLPERKWHDLYKGGDEYEILYYEKDNGGGAKSHDIWWRAWRKPKNDAGGRLRFYFKMDIKTLLLKPGEVVIDGKKFGVDKGELGVKCWFFLDTEADRDAEGKKKSPWDTHPILKLFKRWFWERDRDEVIKQAEEELHEESMWLSAFLERYTGARKEDVLQDWVPPKGYKP